MFDKLNSGGVSDPYTSLLRFLYEADRVSPSASEIAKLYLEYFLYTTIYLK